MGSIKFTIFYLVAMILTNFAYGQKIKLLDNYCVCNGCALRIPKVSKPQLTSFIANDSILQQAALKIKKYFTSEGDHFILFCPSCQAPPRSIGYRVSRSVAAGKQDNGFGTYLDVRTGGNHKGGLDFYKFNELLNFLTDSLLVFDSVELSTASFIGRSDKVLGSLRASYTWQGTRVERTIPYDPENQVIRLSYNILFGDKRARSETDTIPITLSYQRRDERIDVPGQFNVYFATADEKQDLAELYTLYSNAFPDWTIDELANELMVKVTARYKNTLKPNFIQWLTTLKQGTLQNP